MSCRIYTASIIFLTWNWDIAYVLHFCAWYFYIHHIFIHQNLYFFPFSFRRTWFLFDDDDNDIASTKNIPLMDIFLVVVLFFQSMDNIWCQRQENTIDWLLSIEHILCFSSLVVVWKQCFASMSAIYPIYVVCRSEMAKPCNRIRFLLLLLLLFFLVRVFLKI